MGGRRAPNRHPHPREGRLRARHPRAEREHQTAGQTGEAGHEARKDPQAGLKTPPRQKPGRARPEPLARPAPGGDRREWTRKGAEGRGERSDPLRALGAGTTLGQAAAAHHPPKGGRGGEKQTSDERSETRSR
jgi:hypothetical protein